MLAHEVARSDGDVSESELDSIRELIILNDRDDSEQIKKKFLNLVIKTALL